MPQLVSDRRYRRARVNQLRCDSVTYRVETDSLHSERLQQRVQLFLPQLAVTVRTQAIIGEQNAKGILTILADDDEHLRDFAEYME